MGNEIILKKIDDYVAGKLTTEETEDLWIEIMKEPEYMKYLETLITLKDLIESRHPVSVIHTEKNDFWRLYGKWIGLAAALIAIVVGLNLIKLHSTNIQNSTITKISNTALESPVVLRSANVKMTTRDSLLNAGYLAAINGTHEKAIGEFTSLIDQYPESNDAAKAEFNIGVLTYNMQRYKSAEVAFNHALNILHNNLLLKEKTLWYLANTHLKMNDLTAAKKTLKEVRMMNGIYMSKATNLLHKVELTLKNKH